MHLICFEIPRYVRVTNYIDLDYWLIKSELENSKVWHRSLRYFEELFKFWLFWYKLSRHVIVERFFLYLISRNIIKNIISCILGSFCSKRFLDQNSVCPDKNFVAINNWSLDLALRNFVNKLLFLSLEAKIPSIFTLIKGEIPNLLQVLINSWFFVPDLIKHTRVQIKRNWIRDHFNLLLVEEDYNLLVKWQRKALTARLNLNRNVFLWICERVISEILT